MTDNEIVKALECCIDEAKGCKKCPYIVVGCIGDLEENKMLKDVFALINRQKAEIERLTTMHSEMCIGMKRLKSEAYREFAKFLIDKADNGIIYAMDLCDYVVELTEK